MKQTADGIPDLDFFRVRQTAFGRAVAGFYFFPRHGAVQGTEGPSVIEPGCKAIDSKMQQTPNIRIVAGKDDAERIIRIQISPKRPGVMGLRPGFKGTGSW